MRLYILGAACAAALALSACGDNSRSDEMTTDANLTDDSAMNDVLGAEQQAAMNGPAPMPTDAAGFANAVAASDLYEIESSTLAREKATSEQVKSLAQMIQREHGNSTAKLKTAAANAGVSVAPALDAEKTALIEELKGLSGAAFDARYIDQQRTAHQRTLMLLQNYEAAGDNEALKGFAADVRPMVEDHLDRFNAIRK